MSSNRLLLVDDDPQMAVLVGILARRGGLLLSSAADVDTAWALVQSDHPDLVLLDLNLTGSNGLEFLRRRSTAGRSIAIALFCQPGLSADIAAGWRAGADYLLPKDLVTQPAAWQKRVREILEHASGQTTSPSLPMVAVGKFSPSSNLARPEEGAPIDRDWGRCVNHALDHPALRSVGAEVIEQVLCRALVRGFGTEARLSWLDRSAGRLCCSQLPPAPASESLRNCLASLVDQVWCLLGAEASRSLEVALADW